MNENRLTTLQHIKKCLDSIRALIGQVLSATTDALEELEKKITPDTWKKNTKSSEGYVESGEGNPNKVWGTDAQGNPMWRDEAAVTSSVIGVKGSNEEEYRHGEVCITPDNIGITVVNNTADADKSVKYATSAGSATSATSATTASKLGSSNVGSSTKPMYLNAGIPTECGTSLTISVTGSSGSCTGNAATATTASKANTMTNTLTTPAQVSANTNANYYADANAVRAIGNNISVYVGSDSKLHFKNAWGADTAIPFSSVPKIDANLTLHVNKSHGTSYYRGFCFAVPSNGTTIKITALTVSANSSAPYCEMYYNTNDQTYSDTSNGASNQEYGGWAYGTYPFRQSLVKEQIYTITIPPGYNSVSFTFRYSHSGVDSHSDVATATIHIYQE